MVKYEVFLGEHPDRGTYTLDPSPMSMTVTARRGRNHGKLSQPIYSSSTVTRSASCYDLSVAKTPYRISRASRARKLYLVDTIIAAVAAITPMNDR